MKRGRLKKTEARIEIKGGSQKLKMVKRISLWDATKIINFLNYSNSEK